MKIDVLLHLLGLCLALLSTMTSAHAQGTLNFNNRRTGAFAPIYGPNPSDPTVALCGNATTNGGSQNYTGHPLLVGTGFTAQLWAGSLGTPDVALTLFSSTTFQTGTTVAGAITPATLVPIPGTAPGDFVTVQVRAWDNQNGTITTWADALTSCQRGETAAGASASFTAGPLGPAAGPGANLTGLRSFNLSRQRCSCVSPILTCPASFTNTICGNSTVVTFAPPTVTDGALRSCVPASGSVFALGATPVLCTATNASGASTCSFTITVRQVVAPALTCPASIVTNIAGSSVAVSYATPTVVNGALVGCVPASGSRFALGTNGVTCTAINACFTNTCAFSVTVAPLSSGSATNLIALGSAWRYLANGSDQGVGWVGRTFNDASWSNGVAKFGFGNDGEVAVIGNATNGYSTFYFRKSFTVANPAAFSNVIARFIRDDGVAVYVNGVEVFRNNLPAGPLTASTLALTAIGGVDETNPVTTSLSPALLVAGVNVVAAEVHQAGTTSSDLGFDLELTGVAAPPPPLSVVLTDVTPTSGPVGTNVIATAVATGPTGIARVEFRLDGQVFFVDTIQPYTVNYGNMTAGSHTLTAVAYNLGGQSATSAPVTVAIAEQAGFTSLVRNGSIWRYLDDGSDQGTAWRMPGFNDSAWPSGRAELGYGDHTDSPSRPERTVINGGPADSRIPTTYFRHTFNVPNPNAYSNLIVGALRDDGVLVYLNGVEVFRSNMPIGPVNFTTFTGVTAPEDGSNYVYSANAINPALLVPGTNVVAAEIHQSTTNSSDLSFDLMLLAQAAGNQPPVIMSGPVSACSSPGLAVTFAVQAAGTPPLTYQWKKNGVNIPAATAATYTIASVAASDAGDYQVQISNPFGSVLSATATLAVGLPMVNPSFEADTFTVFPGYVRTNFPITGWTALPEHGLSLATGSSPFADNGLVPHGAQVAFLHENGAMSQTVNGFTVGQAYRVEFYENARNCCSGTLPSLEVTIGGFPIVNVHSVPVAGAGNPYRRVVSATFIASAPSLVLAFIKNNPQGGDTAALIDNVCVVPAPPPCLSTGLSLVNAGFETDTYTNWPGYAHVNGPITGWTSGIGHGLNPVAPFGPGDSPFADNGLIPSGRQVAFMQDDGTMSQVVSGFTVGATYHVEYQENARNCCSGALPSLEVKIGGNTIVPAHPITPVGGINPYHPVISAPFVASATSLELAFIKSSPQGGDTTALIDAVCIVQLIATNTAFDGYLLSPTGGASLSVGTNGVLLTSFMAETAYGVALSTPESGDANIAIDPLELSTPGAKLVLAAYGKFGGSSEALVGRAEYRKTGGSNEVFARFSEIGVSAVLVEVYSGDSLLGSWPVMGGLARATVLPGANGMPAIIGAGFRLGDEPQQAEFFFTLSDTAGIVSPTGEVFAGDEIRVSTVGGSLPDLGTTRFELNVIGVSAFLIRCISAGDALIVTSTRPDGSLVLTWNGGGILESTPALPANWSEVPRARSPYVVSRGTFGRFHRVRLPGKRCCGYNISLYHHSAGSAFASVRVSAATTTTKILTAYTANGWGQQFVPPTSVTWSPPAGVMPMGDPIANTFWVRLANAAAADQKLRIEWLNTAGEVLCSQLLNSPCPKPTKDYSGEELPDYSNTVPLCDCVAAVVDTDPAAIELAEPDIDVSFTSTQINASTYKFVNTTEVEPAGLNVAYSWSFTVEDAVGNETDIFPIITYDANNNPTVVFPESGNYNAYLDADGSGCGVDSDFWGERLRASVPVASFFVAPKPCDPYTFTFNDSSGGGIVKWTWSGDVSGSGSSLTWMFPFLNKTYKVCLTVEDADGAVNTACVLVDTTSICFADFEYDYSLCDTPPGQTVNVVVDFTDLSRGNLCTPNWNWDFGDPNSGSLNNSTQQNPSHTYVYPGHAISYDVTLIVTDAFTGETCTQTKTITLSPCAGDFTYTVCYDGSVMLHSTAAAVEWEAPGGYINKKHKNNNLVKVEYYECGVKEVTLKSRDGNHCNCTVTKRFEIPSIGCCSKFEKAEFVHTFSAKGNKTMVGKFKLVQRKNKTVIRAKTKLRWLLADKISAAFAGNVYLSDGTCACALPMWLNEETARTRRHKAVKKIVLDNQKAFLRFHSMLVTHVVTKRGKTEAYTWEFSGCNDTCPP